MTSSILPRVLASAVVLTVAVAAQIEPSFQKKLLDTAPAQQVPIVIMLGEQLDVASLTARLDRANATRAQRHEIVVRAAQDLANASQAALLAKMRELGARGHVSQPQPFWVVNAVAAYATVDAIVTLSMFPGIEQIEDGGAGLELIEPVANQAAPIGVAAAAAEPGLLEIKADFLWNLGYTGAGRIVSNIDTGVDGAHVAFNSRWRGNRAGVAASAAWHSPTLRAPAPRDGNGHGTHTMGTMCGDEGANRIGVAFDADWIASDAIAGSNLTQIRIDAIAAFQWSADPDGNPATVDDVPDVSSNSWGYAPAFHGVPPCDQSFWQGIDIAEAAGVVVVFAAGNEGSRGAQSLRTPSDRATTAFNTFSVGALRPGSTTIASFSSLGPSGCPGNPIKPEVCAQGESVRSSYPGNQYRALSGTSMACPHVAGAVALLRQVDPNLSADQVKSLLFRSANDLGTVGEDNTYGNGRINLEAAYNLLRAEQGAVSVGVVTTTGRVQRGNDLVYALSITNNTAQPRTVVLVLEIAANGVAVPWLGPAFVSMPANFSVDPNWLSGRIALPANLDPVVTTFPFQFRFKALNPNNSQVISQAETEFWITL